MMGEIRCPHCETEIDEHEASRCLDAWVGGAVFGRAIADVDFLGDQEYAFIVEGEGIETLPEYSISIAAAWEVVGRFFRFDVGTDGMLYICEVGVSPTEKFIASANSAPLAICRAALKGLGE